MKMGTSVGLSQKLSDIKWTFEKLGNNYTYEYVK